MEKKQKLKNRPKETNRLFRFFQLNLVCFWVAVVLSAGLVFPIAYAQTFEEYGVEVQIVAENLEIPWAIAFAPDDRIFFTERNGAVRVIEDGMLNPNPVFEFDVGGDGGLFGLAIGGGEGGLLGLALDPNFDENNFLYLYYSYSDSFSTFNRVVRYTENNNQLIDETILIDKIPGSFVHDGGRIKFGPDEKLYITTGDAANANSAQDLNSLAGKILRINSDGSIPDDNPFEKSPVYSYGHRNPQGIDWDPIFGKLVSAEHGPSGERGFAHDEVNVIEIGKNYGWPEVIGGEHDDKYIDPILHTGDDTWAPSGGVFYDSDKISDWNGKFFLATLRGSHLRMLDLDLAENQVISSTALFSNEFGRLRDASMGPDGHLYVLTSNQDGRGSPSKNDDKILRIVPLVFESESSDAKVCKNGFELIFKATNGMPACVFPSSVEKLIAYGWARSN